jgi:hypothetical protein
MKGDVSTPVGQNETGATLFEPAIIKQQVLFVPAAAQGEGGWVLDQQQDIRDAPLLTKLH